MRLTKVEITERSEYRLISARYSCSSGREIDIHFSVAAPHNRRLNDGSATFFILGAIYSFVLGEDYQHSGPIDATLYRNVASLMRQWTQWYPRYRVISVSALIDRPNEFEKAGGRAAFFSGGVDSLFTAIVAQPPVTALISLEHRPNDEKAIADGFVRLAELSAYPNSHNLDHIRIVSNLMTAAPEVMDMWAYMVHGPIVAASAHLLDNSIGSVLLSSTHSMGDLTPWGSHPLTDALASSVKMAVSNFGSTFSRVEKTFEIAKSDAALMSLSVCGLGRLPGPVINCSKCQKCIRTMTTLDLCGTSRERATTFDWADYRPTAIGTLFLRTPNEIIFAREIEVAARRLGRMDIAMACASAIRKSKPFMFLASAELFIRQRFPGVLKHRRRLLEIRSVAYAALGLRRSIR
jgi:hypothetical protein